MGKGPTYRQIHRMLGTTDWSETMKRLGPLYQDIVAEPDRHSRTNIVHLNKLVDEFINEQEERVRREEMAQGTFNSKERTLYKGFIPFYLKGNISWYPTRSHIIYQQLSQSS